MKAIQIEAFGKPVEVVKVVEIPDVGAPGAGEVVLALEASPINHVIINWVWARAAFSH
jgi:NADPH:quinone reductase-like Zn-dependent oxidoreductase